MQQCAGDAKSSKDEEVPQHGGNLAAKGLLEQNVKVVFTLTGGHISPILVGCNQGLPFYESVVFFLLHRFCDHSEQKKKQKKNVGGSALVKVYLHFA